MRICSQCDAKSKGMASGAPYPIYGARSHPAAPAPPFCRPPRVGHLGGGDEDPARRSSRSKCRRAEAGGPEFWPARDGHLPSRWPARRQADGCASRVRLEHRTKGEQCEREVEKSCGTLLPSKNLSVTPCPGALSDLLPSTPPVLHKKSYDTSDFPPVRHLIACSMYSDCAKT